MEVFKLFGTIMIDDKESIGALKKVDKKSKTTSEKLNDVANKGLAIGAAIVAGAGVAVKAMFKITDAAAATTDRIDKLSQRLGLSRQGFQEWDFILSQAGVSIDSLQTGMKTLGQRMQDAIDGAGKGVELFEELGITITESMTQEEAFEATITALQKMEDGVKKADLAQQLFGRNGQDLLPLLNSNADSIEELKEKAHELGIVLSDEAIAAGVEYTDAMDQAQRSTDILKTNIGLMLMPIVQDMLDWFIEHMPEIRETVEEAFTKIQEGIQWIVDHYETLVTALELVLAGFLGLKAISIVNGLIVAYTGFVTTAEGATVAFNAALAANPIGLVLVAIGLLITLLALLIFKWDDVTESIGDAIGLMDEWNGMVMKDKEGTVTVKGNIDPYIKSINQNMGFGFGHIMGFASGVEQAPRGLAWVGEKGPELMYMSGGETVIPHDESMDIMRNNNLKNGDIDLQESNGGVLITGNTFIINDESDIESLAEKLYALIERKRRAGGYA